MSGMQLFYKFTLFSVLIFLSACGKTSFPTRPAPAINSHKIKTPNQSPTPRPSPTPTPVWTTPTPSPTSTSVATPTPTPVPTATPIATPTPFVNVVTNKNIYAEPAPPPLPGINGVIIDPVFQTQILQVTGNSDGNNNINAYSYWPSFNSNSTRLLILDGTNGNTWLYDFDPVSFSISNKRYLFQSPVPGMGYPVNGGDMNWSRINPNVIYAHIGMKIVSYNITTNTYTIIKDLSTVVSSSSGEYVFQMSMSEDEMTFAFTRKNSSYQTIGFLAWNRANNSVYTELTSHCDEVAVDKTGRYLINKTGQQGAGVVEARVIDLATNNVIADLLDNLIYSKFSNKSRYLLKIVWAK